jgi:hypothetical protein
MQGKAIQVEASGVRGAQSPAGTWPGRRRAATHGDEWALRGICSGGARDMMMAPRAHGRPARGGVRTPRDSGVRRSPRPRAGTVRARRRGFEIQLTPV